MAVVMIGKDLDIDFKKGLSGYSKREGFGPNH